MKYLYYAFVALFIYIAGNGIYSQFFKKGARATRLDCQKKVIFFEKLRDKSLIDEAKNALLSKNYDINSSIRKSYYMKSQLFKYVDKNKIDIVLKNKIDTLSTKKLKTDTLKIKYVIWENDKNHPGKKNPKSKLFMGYIVFEFYLKNRLVYESQIDFMDKKGKDIPSRLDCALKAFLSSKELISTTN